MGAAVVYCDVSGYREATVVALMGNVVTVLMGGERASVVAANLRAFRDVRFEWDPSGLWVDPGILVANGVMRVCIGQRVSRLPCSRERAYHFAEAEFRVLCSTAVVATICAAGSDVLSGGGVSGR